MMSLSTASATHRGRSFLSYRIASMLSFLTTDRRDAIPITAVTPQTLPAWIERHPQSRAWLSSLGFKAAPGTFVFLPAPDGRTVGILAAATDESSVFRLAHLPNALPEGKYVIEPDGLRLSGTDMALGWALGSYVF